MDADNNNTDQLLETIRKELNSIINATPSSEISNLNKTKTEIKSSTSDLHVLDSRSSANTNKSVGIKNENLEALNETEVSQRAAFLTNQASQNIDENLQRMKLDLLQTYELFQRIGDKFESINFGTLNTRIKDLHLSTANNDTIKSTNSDLKKLFDQSYSNNRLAELTNEMGDKLHKHPGEFGNIPEISEFFKACSQLQHGLEQLKKQRDEIGSIEKSLNWAAEVSYDRIDEIRKALENDQDKSNV